MVLFNFYNFFNPGTDKYTWNNLEENVTNDKKELFDYWVAYYDEVPFSLIMTTNASEDSPAHLIIKV